MGLLFPGLAALVWLLCCAGRYSNIGFPNIHFYIGTFSNWTIARLLRIFLAKLARRNISTKFRCFPSLPHPPMSKWSRKSQIPPWSDGMGSDLCVTDCNESETLLRFNWCDSEQGDMELWPSSIRFCIQLILVAIFSKYLYNNLVRSNFTWIFLSTLINQGFNTEPNSASGADAYLSSLTLERGPRGWKPKSG